MSMINDALKRAQKTRPSNVPGPRLRAAEPSQFANRSLLLVVPALLVFAVLIGAFFLWQAFQNPARNPEPVRAKTIAPENPEPVKPEPVKAKTVVAENPTPKVVPPPVQKAVQQPTQKIVQRPVQIAMASAPKPKPATPKPASVAAPAPTPQKTSVSATPAIAPAPTVVAPPPTPVKLQAIFYSPGRSTAMINGKTVAVGDALKEYRITTITPTSVRIISFTQTNVLTLPPQ
jgi:hypothetical protein